MVELLPSHPSNVLDTPVLHPMLVVNEVEHTCGALIAPKRLSAVGKDVREGAVEQLEELVPLRRVVLPRLPATEANSIMVDMLAKDNNDKRQ